MVFSTEKILDDFLGLNSCGVENLSNINRVTKRENGRVDYHILYIFKGKCTLTDNGKETVAHDGDMILFKPKEPQHYSFNAADKTISCYIHFSGTECDYYLKKFGLYDDRIMHIGVSNTIRNVFLRLKHEYLVRKKFSDEYCSALVLELLLLMGRERLNVTSSNPKIDQRIDIVRKEMIENPNNWHDIKYYADKCNLSTSRFQHVFKNQTGYSPSDYIMYMRIRHACDLICETDLTTAQIADTLGFSTSTYFIRCFKKLTGQTPGEYKRQQFNN